MGRNRNNTRPVGAVPLRRPSTLHKSPAVIAGLDGVRALRDAQERVPYRLGVALFCLLLTLALTACSAPASPVNNPTSMDGTPATASSPSSSAGDGDVTGATSATLSFAGDVTLSSPEPSTAFDAYYQRYGAAYFLSNVQRVFAHDDLTVVNLEGPITTSTAKADKGSGRAFWFKAPLSYVKILTSSSVEACTVANNHSMDWGQAGLDQSRATLKKAGVAYFGYNDVLVRDVKGIKFGFFGLAFNSSTAKIQNLIDELKQQGAQVIIGYYHDGIEGSSSPTQNQETTARYAIDNGAKAVIISHPHVLQGTEDYHGGFIAYSMGNFCFGGNTNPTDKDSMIVQLHFTRDASGAITMTHTLIPCSVSGHTGYNDYQPRILSGSEAKRVLAKIAARSKLI